MKILSVEQIRKADQYTIELEPISDIALMERAAQKIVHWLIENIEKKTKFYFFVGKGNNGGDAYAVARLINEQGYQTFVYSIGLPEKQSDSCQINCQHYLKLGSVSPILSIDDFPHIGSNDVIVDGIFGSGLSRPVTGFYGQIIKEINTLDNIVIAIDIPSGLFADQSNTLFDGAVIEANKTLSFQFPKKAFLFPENYKYVGEFEILDIGLHPKYIEEVKCTDFFITRDEIKQKLKIRTKYSHKGTFGHGLLMAGSYGKYGAAILAARASIRSGAGLITAHLPSTAMNAMQVAAPEIMISFDNDDQILTHLPILDNYNAIACGPGIGKDILTQNLLDNLFDKIQVPLVLDADALNIISENKDLLIKIPPNTILTPHPKEFERLFGKTKNNFERYELLKEQAQRLNLIIILKGAHTEIAFPDGVVFFNSTGNPGMATAGSGDVLTGILLGLLTAGYTSENAALLGVYLHGLSGDIAVENLAAESLIASDIINNLAKAFNKLRANTTF